jgi:hypothetical protein
MPKPRSHAPGSTLNRLRVPKAMPVNLKLNQYHDLLGLTQQTSESDHWIVRDIYRVILPLVT